MVPTVPFLLLAAWAAARSSPRLLAWLEHHPHFGLTPARLSATARVVRRRANRRRDRGHERQRRVAAVVCEIHGPRCWRLPAWRWCCVGRDAA